MQSIYSPVTRPIQNAILAYLPLKGEYMCNSDEYLQSAVFYDYITMYKERDDQEFYLEMASDTNGKILELGCGTGRILLPLAREGNTITGLDSSAAMLDVCRKKLLREDDGTRKRVTLAAGDMRNFELKDSFQLVTVPFRGFQHLLTVEDQLQCLGRVREHIAEDGTFVLDLFNPSMKYILDESRKDEFGREPPFEMPDGSTVTRRFRNPSVDLASQIIDCRIIYRIEKPDGKSLERTHSFKLRYLFRYEAEHLLERAGFRVRKVLGDYGGNSFGTDWPGELILIAEPEN
ncbi:MAG: methyltransferase domain-containing protein [Candidatus Aegiribacteria sp.]|nr:methyltransferase domain-containing protein [Candidatus Aegiribacteria sp.]MBD3295481.1 methyltransferase domain-containing protein [Candidatus Fermentibacteria bacterium]